MRCHRCDRKATARWTLNACADTRKRKRAVWLCKQCDYMLNDLTLSFLVSRKLARKMMKEYRHAAHD